MPAITVTTSDSAELADLSGCLRDWSDLEQDQLEPLLDEHGYHLIGLRIALDRLTSLLTHDDEPAFRYPTQQSNISPPAT